MSDSVALDQIIAYSSECNSLTLMFDLLVEMIHHGFCLIGCYKSSRDDIMTGLRTNCNKAKQVLQAGYRCTETECITNCIEASRLHLCPKPAAVDRRLKLHNHNVNNDSADQQILHETLTHTLIHT